MRKQPKSPKIIDVDLNGKFNIDIRNDYDNEVVSSKRASILKIVIYKKSIRIFLDGLLITDRTFENGDFLNIK